MPTTKTKQQIRGHSDPFFHLSMIKKLSAFKRSANPAQTLALNKNCPIYLYLYIYIYKEKYLYIYEQSPQTKNRFCLGGVSSHTII